jgi:hypothetical protein
MQRKSLGAKVSVAIEAIARVFNNARRSGEPVLVTFLLGFGGPLVGSGSESTGASASVSAAPTTSGSAAASLSPAPIEGTIGDGPNKTRDVDLFKIVVAKGQTLTLDIDAQSRTPKSTLDSVVRLFDANGRLVASNDNDTRSGSFSRDSYLSWTASTAGTYYVGVSGFGNAAYSPLAVGTDRKAGSTGSYLLTATLAGPAMGSTGPGATSLAFAALAENGPSVRRKTL